MEGGGGGRDFGLGRAWNVIYGWLGMVRPLGRTHSTRMAASRTEKGEREREMGDKSKKG